MNVSWMCEHDTYQLDGVGPVDNRPSINKLHQIVQKKKKKKNCDMWHMTRDTWHVGGDEDSLKISAP